MCVDATILQASLQHGSNVCQSAALSHGQIADEEAMFLAEAHLQMPGIWIQQVTDALVDSARCIENLCKGGSNRDSGASGAFTYLPEESTSCSYDQAIVPLDLVPTVRCTVAGARPPHHSVRLATAGLAIGQDGGSISSNCCVEQAGHTAFLENLFLRSIFGKTRVEGILSKLVRRTHPYQDRPVTGGLAAILVPGFKLLL
mmetsp:Transcript_124110/g.294614  ORF Transcript_124110/g.294614 Transcript_124110/m.294614 type:complete len:201 (+) Transcript_124110:198-800(+)